MSTQDRDERDGVEPTEEVGAEECSVRVDRTEFKQGEIDDTDQPGPSFLEEIQDAYQPEAEPMVPSLIDGMPVPMGETNDPHEAPPFTRDHVVCVEDDRQYVLLFLDELDGDAARMYEKGWLATWPRLMPPVIRARLGFPQSRVEDFCGVKVVRLTTDELFTSGLDTKPGEMAPYVPVRPIRERCVHYKRQLLSNDAQPDPDAFGGKIMFRNCMARRSIGGAFMSLRDEAIFACDFRDPPDPVSTKKHLDEPDRMRLESEAHRVRLPLFKTDTKGSAGT